ncbi:hypothetical protein [Enterococcus hirae]|uniref:hypothetical protein n=1 Tax=Enterococcus hirae TaxID=1354 RepID=UPI00136DCFE9|nr:hypothetical protein [Enterococcus hirae]NAE18092.1 hypothetical protein [Enterococcus hirae]
MASTTLTGATYIPRKPAKRGEIKSFTPLHLRERVALVRCWLHDNPQKRSAGLGAALAVTLEHYQTSFPWVIEHVQSAAHFVSGLAGVYGA